MGHQLRESLLLHQSSAAVSVVPLELEAFHQPIRHLQEPRDGGAVHGLAHDQIPLLGEGPALRIGKRRVVHTEKE